nr:MAG TPA: hypothetical protein [Caudoviricetes sp.]
MFMFLRHSFTFLNLTIESWSFLPFLHFLPLLG